MTAPAITISMGTFSARELVTRILEVFGAEVHAEIQKGAPVDHGYLRDHWVLEWPVRDNRIRVGTNAFYAPFHTLGTGIFGPLRRMICARGARREGRYDAPDPALPKALAWRAKGGSLLVRRCVRGIRPNPYVENGMEKGVENAMAALQEMAQRGDL